MPSFLVGSDLSRGDLCLYLTNGEGLSQDAASVRWTVYAADGRKVSGKSLKAIRRQVGEYYAPWSAQVSNGSYQIVWEVFPTYDSPASIRVEPFFVVDPSSFGPAMHQAAVPVPGGRAYLSGTILGPGDLPLFLTSADGFLYDAYSISWAVMDASGRQVSPRSAPGHFAQGEYFAPWTAASSSGDYTIRWEWQEAQGSPSQSADMRFSVINPYSPFAVYVPTHCTSPEPIIFTQARPIIPWTVPYCAPCAPQVSCAPVLPQQPYAPSLSACPVSTGSCSGYEVPRTVHLEYLQLPAGGAFTTQPSWHIPQGIRRVTFYITYARGAAGGYASLRLMWGNGQEESQETLVDCEITVNGDESSQNLFLQELDGPVPPDSSPITFILQTTAPGGARTVRLLAAEEGMPGSPGTLGITLTAATT